MRHSTVLPASLLLALACARSSSSPATDEVARSPSASSQSPAHGLPAGEADAAERLRSSLRHGEWAMVAAGASDSVRAWVVYPERRERAPVVGVVHEIYGLTPWIRAVADQFAADGFVAIAPDLLTGKNVLGRPGWPATRIRRRGGSRADRYFPGAGHGFLRAQDARNGANLAATRNAWPRTVTWFRKHLGD